MTEKEKRTAVVARLGWIRATLVRLGDEVDAVVGLVSATPATATPATATPATATPATATPATAMYRRRAGRSGRRR